MDRTTLLLNATYEPLKVISWQKAIGLLFGGKAEVVEEYDDFDLKSPSITMKCPAVLKLRKYVKGDKTKVKFSRSNIFARDNYKCAYCEKTFHKDDLTMDHLIPRSRGGKTEWTNIVASCYPCNSKKGNRTPEEAKMTLKFSATCPENHPGFRLMMQTRGIHPEWTSYLN